MQRVAIVRYECEYPCCLVDSLNAPYCSLKVYKKRQKAGLLFYLLLSNETLQVWLFTDYFRLRSATVLIVMAQELGLADQFDSNQ